MSLATAMARFAPSATRTVPLLSDATRQRGTRQGGGPRLRLGWVVVGVYALVRVVAGGRGAVSGVGVAPGRGCPGCARRRVQGRGRAVAGGGAGPGDAASAGRGDSAAPVTVRVQQPDWTCELYFSLY